MAAQITVELSGIRELQAKVTANPVYRAPAKRALSRIGEIGVQAARRHAPKRSGALADSISYKVNGSPQPLWVVIKVAATRSSRKYRNYPYPRRLEFDPKSRHRDWLKRAIEGAFGQMNGALSQAGHEIETEWGH